MNKLDAMLFDHRCFTFSDNHLIQDFFYDASHKQDYAIVGMGDFGEALVDECIKRQCLNMDFSFINSSSLFKTEDDAAYKKYNQCESFIDASRKDQATRSVIISNIERLVQHKRVVFIALTLACDFSVELLQQIITVAKKQGCIVVTLFHEPLLPSDIKDRDIEAVAKGLGASDSILEIPCYASLGLNGAAYSDDLLYRNRIGSYVDAMVCLMPSLHESGDWPEIESFLQQNRYIRCVVSSIRENDIEVAGDILTAIKRDYPELENQKSVFGDNVIVQLYCADARVTDTLLKVVTHTLSEILPNTPSHLIINNDDRCEIHVLIGSREVDIAALLRRQGVYQTNVDDYQLFLRKDEQVTEKQLKKFTCSRDEAYQDLLLAHEKVVGLYKTKSEQVEALSRYADCYGYGIKVDKEGAVDLPW